MADPKRNKSAPSCPNPAFGPHNITTASNSRLSQGQVRSALAAIDLGQSSRLRRYASYRGWRAGIDADDLLQEALLRALSSRSCPASITIEVFLMGIMRSIASAIVEKREREREIIVEVGGTDSWAAAGARLAQPDEILGRQDHQRVCAAALASICEGNPHAETVLDGINLGLRGLDLARHANIDPDHLATVRRFLKRRAAGVWDGLADKESTAA